MYLPNINSNINIKISQNLWILFLSNFHLDLVWSYVTVRFLARFPLNICEADRRLRNIQPVVACEVESSVLHWHKPTSLAIRFIILFLCSSYIWTISLGSFNVYRLAFMLWIESLIILFINLNKYRYRTGIRLREICNYQVPVPVIKLTKKGFRSVQ